MRVLSLFSGIGAFEKALDNLHIPYELVAYCEIDKYASRSYSAIHGVPESANLGDITKISLNELPGGGINLLTYGFPCQDISVCGNRTGLFHEDGTQTRSGLFFDALRIIEHTQPDVAIAENVRNLLSKRFEKEFQTVLDSLESAGYKNYFAVLNAKNFGVPQNRDRVLIVSIRKSLCAREFHFPEGFPLTVCLRDVLEPVVDERFYLSPKMVEYVTAKVDGCRFDGEIDPPLAHALTATQHKMHRAGVDTYVSDRCVEVASLNHYQNDQMNRVYGTNGISPTVMTKTGGGRETKILDGRRIRRLTPRECFRLMGFTDDDFDKAAVLNSNTQLYKQAGNSIVVPVLEHIIRALIDCGALEGRKENG